MKEFKIWMEGYVATGNFSKAQLLGKVTANTFDEAVEQYIIDNPNNGIERIEEDSFDSAESYERRRSNWEIWACELFDNEKDARKSFG